MNAEPATHKIISPELKAALDKILDGQAQEGEEMRAQGFIFTLLPDRQLHIQHEVYGEGGIWQMPNWTEKHNGQPTEPTNP